MLLMVDDAELMLLGFISLLLAVSQDRIARICIPKRYSDDWLPCKKIKDDSGENSTSHFQIFISQGGRRLLAEDSASSSYCAKRVFPFPPTLLHFNNSQSTRLRQWI